MRVDPGLIAADIELKHAQRRRRRLRYRFEAGLADRAQHMRDAEFMRRLHDGCAAARIKRLQGADRTEHDRQPQPAAEKFDRGIDLAHVAQHARTQRDRIERQAVAQHRRLGFRPADDVVPIVLVQVGARLGDELVQVQEFAGHGSAQRGGFVGTLVGHVGEKAVVAAGLGLGWLSGRTANDCAKST